MEFPTVCCIGWKSLLNEWIVFNNSGNNHILLQTCRWPDWNIIPLDDSRMRTGEGQHHRVSNRLMIRCWCFCLKDESPWVIVNTLQEYSYCVVYVFTCVHVCEFPRVRSSTFMCVSVRMCSGAFLCLCLFKAFWCRCVCVCLSVICVRVS